MTGNALRNAGLVDGTDGFTGRMSWWPDHAPYAALAVLTAGVGAPGRRVLQVATTAQGVSLDNALVVSSAPVAVEAGAAIEAAAMIAGEAVATNCAVMISDASGAYFSLLDVPLVRPALAAAPVLGLADGFATYAARLVAPIKGYAVLQAWGWGLDAVQRPGKVWLQKPFLDLAAPDLPYPQVFDPGSHAAAGLDRPAWLPGLPRFLAESTIEPIADSVEFKTDSGIGVAQRTYAGLRRLFRGRLRLSRAQAARLEAWYEARGVNGASGGFWFVRPDTNELCLATWSADGAPRPVRLAGAWPVYEIGLQLGPAV